MNIGTGLDVIGPEFSLAFGRSGTHGQWSLSVGALPSWSNGSSNGGNEQMAKDNISDLIAKLHLGRIDRRDFIKRAGAAGLSAALVGQVLGRYDSASAQQATPSTGVSSTTIGAPGHQHVTDTSKGIIKIFSSWPLTGTYDRLGNDAVEAVKLCLDDFGNAAGGFALEYEALDDGTAANNGGPDQAKETENVNRVVAD